jgi:hypothetical protein
MTVSGPRSGKHGVVYAYVWDSIEQAYEENACGLAQVRNWNLNILGQVETRVHSASWGGPERYPGIEDFNVTVEGFGAFPCATFPGYYANLYLFAGPDDGVAGHDGVAYNLDVICDSLTLTWNWEPTRSLMWSAVFSSTGCLEMESENTWILDESTECYDRMCGLLLAYRNACAGSGGATPIDGVTNATLTFTCNNQTAMNSSMDCCTYRTPGGLTDWTLDITQQEDYYTFLNTELYEFLLYNTVSTYWDLQWGILDNVSNIRVDRETGAIKTKTYNIKMNGRACCGSAVAQIGQILNPDGTQMWPEEIDTP